VKEGEVFIRETYDGEIEIGVLVKIEGLGFLMETKKYFEMIFTRRPKNDWEYVGEL